MDELTNQAIDIVLKNNALRERVIDPFKRILVPLAACIGVFNILIFVMLCYLTNRLSAIL